MPNELVWSVAERMQGEIATQIRILLGEELYDERIFTDEERSRRIDAMKLCAEVSLSDEERHESWCKMHTDMGWVHGPTFDPKAKTHPNLLPWSQLPPSVKVKAKIFDIIAKAAKSLSE
jgi:hypothetical protein